jgi:four helix bundle protein
MPIHRYYEFDAWKLADAFKSCVFALLKDSPDAWHDRKFRGQLVESARGPTKHIAEGFLRKSPAAFMLYLDYAVSSLAEAREHLRDGIALGYFSARSCQDAFVLCRRSMSACLALKRSQLRYLQEQDRRNQSRRKRKA